MCISTFYAQVLGLWLFLIGLAMVVHHARFKKTVMESLNQAPLMNVTGFIALLIGLIIVTTHNIWVSAWPVVITIIGWVYVIQGVMRIYWPDSFAKMMKDLKAKSGDTVLTWIWLIVGLYLIWAGFGN